MKKLCLAGILFMLYGCASNFATFYQGASKEQIDTMSKLDCDEPQMRPLPNKAAGEIVGELFEEGYGSIGHSHFTAADGDGRSAALRHAKGMGACLVLYGQAYKGSHTAVMPVTTPTSTTTYASGTVSSGMATGYYSGTATSYGTQTTYVPYAVHRHEYAAVYFIKLPPPKFGVLPNPSGPPDSYKRQFDTNQGILVHAVRKGGAAYRANILRGDILVSINGKPVANDSWPETPSGKHTLKLVRDGKAMEKEFSIE